jgi:hypothetical protein
MNQRGAKKQSAESACGSYSCAGNGLKIRRTAELYYFQVSLANRIIFVTPRSCDTLPIPLK